MHVRGLIVTALLAFAAACGDATAPTRDVFFSTCNASWAAYQNEGADWRRISDLGFVGVALTERVAIAMVDFAGNGTGLSVSYLAADQVPAAFECPISPSGLTFHEVNGSVRGVNPGQEAWITFGFASMAPVNSAFRMFGVTQGSHDLLASRMRLTTGRYESDRVIIRRDQSWTDESTMPALNFDSTEAFAPQPNIITITNAPPEAMFVRSSVFTESMLPHYLTMLEWQGGPATIYSIPTARQEAGDLHVLEGALDGAVRQFEYFYTAPSDRMIAFGPPPSTPTFSEVGNAARRLVRVDMPSQPVYGSTIEILLWNGANPVRLMATREYFGATPTTWSLATPDLSGVDGYRPEWGLGSDAKDWRVIVSSRPSGRTYRQGRDGDLWYTAQVEGQY